MKRLHTVCILVDRVDIFFISFSVEFTIVYGFKKYRNSKKIKMTVEDPIVSELKRKSPIQIFSIKGKPLKLPLIRGGDKIQELSLMIRSRKLTKILWAISNARQSQRKAILRCFSFSQCTIILVASTGFHIATGSFNYTQIILIAFSITDRWLFDEDNICILSSQCYVTNNNLIWPWYRRYTRFL